MTKLSTALIALAMTVATPLTAFAQYPERSINLVVGWAPGGITDAFARTLAPYLEEQLGVSILVENKGGASGAIGAASVAAAPADGYTLLFAVASHAIIPATDVTLTYDIVDDFQYLSLLHTAPTVIAVNAGTGISTIEELIAAAKAAPGEFNYASSGFGTVSHVAMASLALSQDLDVVHIPYQGSGEGLQAGISGEVQIVSTSIAQALEYFQSGELIPLAVGGSARDALLPEVPTFDEVGISGVRGDAWFGLMGPSGMPDEVVAKLSEAIDTVLANEEYVAALKQRSQNIVGLGAAEFADLIKQDLEINLALRDAGMLQQD